MVLKYYRRASIVFDKNCAIYVKTSYHNNNIQLLLNTTFELPT